MSISYPLDMPTDVIGISQITLRPRNAVGVSRSPFTYQQQTQRYPGQAWVATISLAPVNREYAEPWIGFLVSLEGPVGTFLLGDPSGSRPRGALRNFSDWLLAGGTWRDAGVWRNDISWDETGESLVFDSPTVDGAHASDSRDLRLRGLPANTAAVFEVGDYIQLGFGATATLHKVLRTVGTDSMGGATLSIWPRLRRSVASGEMVVYINPRGRFRLPSDFPGWEINSNLRYGISFEVEEAF